ncbi:MAG: hypothetical protein ABJA64_01540 [Candidatus Saccharibacteria bacterium]
MKKRIIFICIGLSLAIVLNQFGLWNALMLFLLVGAIPGTSLNISPLVMLTLFVIISGSIALHFSHPVEVQKVTKKTTPKRRYSRI